MEDFGEYTIILSQKDLSEMKEILEISLNIIFFHRNLSSNNCEDTTGKLINISYAKLKSQKLSKEISNILDTLEKNLNLENNLYGCQITLNFYEKSEKNKNFENPWEKWIFISNLVKGEVLKEKNDSNSNSSCLDKENIIREYIFKIIDKLNDKENYMPKITFDDKNSEEETFSHNFKIDTIETEEEYLALFNNYVKKNKENVIIINQLP